MRFRVLSWWVLFFLSGARLLGIDPVMGNWEGHFQTEGGESGLLRAQVIALGSGSYLARFTVADTGRPIDLEGTTEGGITRFSGTPDLGAESGGVTTVRPTVAQGVFDGTFSDAAVSGGFRLKRVHRTPPNLGAPPPEGAVVLFDGTSLEAWKHPNGSPAGWKTFPGGILQADKGNLISRKEFGDARIHLEFRTPFVPE